MIYFKCKNCGGELTFSESGSLICPYCGTKSYFSDSELGSYKEFRLKMLEYLRTCADDNAKSKNSFFLWNYSDSVRYTTANGDSVDIEYLFYSEEDGVKTYVAKNSVVYVFPASGKSKAAAMRSNLNMLDYPAADTKNLKKCFPTIINEITLDDSSVLIAVSKAENVYPLFAFGNLRCEHVAWIVSRLENICCVLEYSDIVHGGITTDSVFINPDTHEGMLYGNWWRAARKPSGHRSRDLDDIRTVASKLLGPYKEAIPKEFSVFLRSRTADNAFDDFSAWDYVIEHGMGGHKFTKFSTK